MIMDLTLHTAIVENLNDPDKKGKIQIRINPQLLKVETSLLPYAVPFITHNTDSTLENDLPELHSTVWVLVSHDWKRFYYLGNRYFYNLFQYNKPENILKKITEISDTDYTHLSFKMYKDGGLVFHNKQDGSHGFIHKSGSYSIFDKNGNVVVNAFNQKIKVYNNITSLKDILDTLQQIVQNICTPMNFIAPNGPVTYNLAGQDLPKIIQLKNTIDSLLTN